MINFRDMRCTVSSDKNQCQICCHLISHSRLSQARERVEERNERERERKWVRDVRCQIWINGNKLLPLLAWGTICLSRHFNCRRGKQNKKYICLFILTAPNRGEASFCVAYFRAAPLINQRVYFEPRGRWREGIYQSDMIMLLMGR